MSGIKTENDTQVQRAKDFSKARIKWYVIMFYIQFSVISLDALKHKCPYLPYWLDNHLQMSTRQIWKYKMSVMYSAASLWKGKTFWVLDILFSSISLMKTQLLYVTIIMSSAE